ncbi:NAD(P)-dependent oxidoreductase [Paenibacillus sp. GSMTC-2017]|uniref:NAD-dependent epimerase/dehydratase family protein n=1 Tax=Paenibacillus sp. GSMTC-2017 TaxID=2794350 RepID=UPI0018DA06D4|nr:NAD(P)-dependent oxidoreductase [Paenibacillus sp. GSMTC-2017]MBH5319146.1 NAD(P)-dependent oxidoreductase [Paenibacillus sp. GSMTC-2017]
MSKGKTVLVTGAGGYIGSNVVTSLLDMGINVTAISHKTTHIDSRATIISYDIFGGSDNIYEELGRPDVCLHMAWTDGFVHNSDSHMKNLFFHYQFIKNMINGGLKHIAIMGTMHEVGYHEGEINESTPNMPYSLYGVAKNSLRQSIEILLKDQNTIFQWIRAFYIYGDDQRNNSIFTKIIQAERDGKENFPFTSGKNQYDFININDLAHQISLTVLQDTVNGIINCCSGKPIALKDMVENFLSENGLKIKLNYGAFPDRPYDSPAVWGSNDKVEKILQASRNKEGVV